MKLDTRARLRSILLRRGGGSPRPSVQVQRLSDRDAPSLSGPEAVLSRALSRQIESRIPPSADLWPRIERRVQLNQGVSTTTNSRLHGWRLIKPMYLIALVCLLAIVGGTLGVPAVASSVRSILGLPASRPGHSAQGMDANGRPAVIYPPPPFRVYYPHSLPQGMIYRAIAVLDGVVLTVNSLSAGANCSNSSSPKQCARALRHVTQTIFPGLNGPPWRPALVTPLTGHHGSVNVLWLGMHAVPPGRRRLEIVEWDTGMLPLRTVTDTIRLHRRMTLGEDAGESVVALQKGNTGILIGSNIGKATTRGLAAVLEPIDISGRASH
jgi:hypothetical protein